LFGLGAIHAEHEGKERFACKVQKGKKTAMLMVKKIMKKGRSGFGKELPACRR
jgi:hypothetical protein